MDTLASARSRRRTLCLRPCFPPARGQILTPCSASALGYAAGRIHWAASSSDQKKILRLFSGPFWDRSRWAADTMLQLLYVFLLVIQPATGLSTSIFLWPSVETIRTFTFHISFRILQVSFSCASLFSYQDLPYHTSPTLVPLPCDSMK